MNLEKFYKKVTFSQKISFYQKCEEYAKKYINSGEEMKNLTQCEKHDVFIEVLEKIGLWSMNSILIKM